MGSDESKLSSTRKNGLVDISGRASAIGAGDIHIELMDSGKDHIELNVSSPNGIVETGGHTSSMLTKRASTKDKPPDVILDMSREEDGSGVVVEEKRGVFSSFFSRGDENDVGGDWSEEEEDEEESEDEVEEEEKHLYTTTNEKRQVVCIQIGEGNYAEVAKVQTNELNNITARVKELNLSYNDYDDDDDDDYTTHKEDFGEILRESFNTPDEDIESQQQQQQHNPKEQQYRERELLFFPYLSVGRDKALVRITNVVQVRSDDQVAEIHDQAQKLFRRDLSFALNEEKNEVDAIRVQEIVRDTQAKGCDFSSVSADTFFAVQILKRRHDEALNKLDEFLSECNQETNEFSAKEVKSRLQVIRDLIYKEVSEDNDTMERPLAPVLGESNNN